MSMLAQQPVTLFKQFNGSFDFIVFGNTLNRSDNSIITDCSILNTSSANFVLEPQFILSQAYLYWAGSGTIDPEVTLNGITVVAERQFNVSTGGLPYFSAFADVTSVVANTTTGTYTLSDIEITTSPHCETNGTNFGGWSIVVIYEDPAFNIDRQVSVYDGFQFVGDGRPLNITLDFLSITDPQDSRIGFLSWEGDRNLAITEQVQVNGNIISDPPLNPANNVFNGTNSYTGSDELYNMDLDAFTIQPFINAGDTSAELTLTSGRDFVIINNIIAAYNSQLEVDAVIEIEQISECGGETALINYKVTNQGTLGLLTRDTPIAFYIDTELVGLTKTETFLAPNAFETGSIVLQVPVGINEEFTVRAVVDDNGTGVGIIDETNENNNEDFITFQLPPPPLPVFFDVCDEFEENEGVAEINLQNQELIDLVLNGAPQNQFILTFHEFETDALNNTNPLSNPYVNVTNPQIIYARLQKIGTVCFTITEVNINIVLRPVFFLEAMYRLCVDINDNPTTQEFGTPSPPVIDTGLNAADFKFTWTLNGAIIPGETSPALLVQEGGEYSVSVERLSTGCVATKFTTVTVSSAPFNVNAEVTSNAFADTHTVEIFNEGLGSYQYQLDGGPFQNEALFEDVLPGTHTVTVTDTNGCGTVKILDIVIIDYPKFVTPNNDGFNDRWNIAHLSRISPNAKIYIFDRYGKLLKEINPLGPGWDGTYNGNPMPSSDYWFRIEYVEDNTPKQIKGHFTLKR